MDRDTAVATIARRLGNRTDLTRLGIVDEMQLAQTRLENEILEIPWFLLSEVSQATTTVDEERLEIPSDFLKEHEEGTLFLYDSSLDDPWVGLEKHDWDDIVAKYTTTGQPKVYALVGKYFRLGPVPDAAYEMKMIYFKHDTVLSTNIENLWLEHVPELLIAETGKIIAENIVNDKAYARFSNDRTTAMTALMKTNVARQMANREYYMGGGE